MVRLDPVRPGPEGSQLGLEFLGVLAERARVGGCGPGQGGRDPVRESAHRGNVVPDVLVQLPARGSSLARDVHSVDHVSGGVA